jgi:hypothetical protein
MSSCAYCSSDHTYVCDCGHRHDDHIYSGGCKASFCKCPGYTQRRQRRPAETQKEFEHRVLHPVTVRKKTKRGAYA